MYGLVNNKKKQMGFIESLFSGLGQGLTFGMSDEAVGALGALYAKTFAPELFQNQSISDLYKDARDQERNANALAKQQNPNVYGAAELAGGFALPVASFGGGLSGALKAGAGYGGLAGYGYSNEKSIPKQAKDIAIGSMLGAGLGAAGYGAVKAAQNPQVKKFAKEFITDESGALKILPQSEKLNTPNNPTKQQMKDFSYIQDVPLDMARAGQTKMEWDKFNKKEYAKPLVDGYSDLPIAVKLENGEYIIKDGNHRTVNEINKGAKNMKMHVIDAKNYDPQNQGVRPKNLNKKEIQDLLNQLLN